MELDGTLFRHSVNGPTILYDGLETLFCRTHIFPLLDGNYKLTIPSCRSRQGGHAGITYSDIAVPHEILRLSLFVRTRS